jgi:hypothetical protein
MLWQPSADHAALEIVWDEFFRVVCDG